MDFIFGIFVIIFLILFGKFACDYEKAPLVYHGEIVDYNITAGMLSKVAVVELKDGRKMTINTSQIRTGMHVYEKMGGLRVECCPPTNK